MTGFLNGNIKSSLEMMAATQQDLPYHPIHRSPCHVFLLLVFLSLSFPHSSPYSDLFPSLISFLLPPITHSLCSFLTFVFKGRFGFDQDPWDIGLVTGLKCQFFYTSRFSLFDFPRDSSTVFFFILRFLTYRRSLMSFLSSFSAGRTRETGAVASVVCCWQTTGDSSLQCWNV